MREIKRIIRLILLLTLFGCSAKNKDFEFAVIQTSSTKEESKIIYFDKHLTNTYSEILKYAELGTPFYKPYYNGQDVFLVPRGLQGYHNTNEVISINISDKKLKSYDIDKTNIICTAANEDFIYTSSNLNMISYLTLIDKKSQDTKELSFPNEYLSMIVCSEDKVYTFFTSLNSANLYSVIRIYDNTLTYLDELDISKLGINQTKHLIDDGLIYFTNTYNIRDEKNNILGILDIKNQTVSAIPLIIDYPDDIEIYKNKLYISSSNPNNPTTSIECLNLIHMDQEVYNLESSILTMKIKDNSLYVLDQNDKIDIYDLKSDIEIKNTILLESTLNSYYSTLFISN